MREHGDGAVRRIGILAARALGLRAGDGALALLGAACSFCVLASYYLMRPVRDEIGSAGARDLEWLFWATFAGTLLVSPLFAVAVSCMRRGAFIALSFRLFALQIVCFGALSATLEGDVLRWCGYAFFVWLSVYVMFVVSVVWSLMADVSGVAESRRAFGVIAAGSSLGAMASSGLTAVWLHGVERVWVLAVAALLLEASVWLARMVDRRLPARAVVAPTDELDIVGSERIPLGRAASGLWAGAVLIGRSPYLLLVCLYLFLHTFDGTAMYFEQSRIVKELIDDAGDRRAFLATIDFWVNGLALVVQLFIAGRIMSRVGTWVALMALPVVCGLALISLPIAMGGGVGPGALLATVMGAQIVRRVSNYALAKPARETLFTVVSRGEKYKAKNLLDTVVYRGGDAVSGSAFSVMSGAIPAWLLTGVLVPVMAGWAALGWVLSRAQSARSGPESPEIVQPTAVA